MKISCPRCYGAGKIEATPLAVLFSRGAVTQDQAAKAIGTTQGNLNRMIHTGRITARFRNSLAALFSVTVAQLIGAAPLTASKASSRGKRVPPKKDRRAP